MKILIITYYYAPSVTPRALRWSAIAGYLKKLGHRVDVVCAKTTNGTDAGIDDGVNVNETSGGILDGFKSTLLKKQAANSRRSGGRNTAGGEKIRFSTKGLIKNVYDLTWKKIYWPDFACLWFFPAITAAKKLLQTKDYDCLITVSHPFTCHMVGHWLRRRHAIPCWIVDIGDPFCFVETTPLNNPKLYPRINARVERKVFAAADTVSVTTDGTAAIYATLFPESRSKIKVIPPVYSLDTSAISRNPPFKRDPGKIVLLYVGTLYSGIRSPRFLLEVFDALPPPRDGRRVELHFIGLVHDCHAAFQSYVKRIGKTLFLHGEIAREAVAPVLREADILINIGNLTSYQLPSKLVEYVSLGKPILNLHKHPQDTSLSFLKGYPAALNMLETTDPTLAAGLLNDFINDADDLCESALATWRAPFTVEKITGVYLNMAAGTLGGTGICNG
ncbi:MAG: glycosyltransferase [Pseudomonadota bacterium]